MQEFLQQSINGLSLGSIYAVLALGLAMVYSTLGILNFAYGELVTIVGYTMYFVSLIGAPFVLAAALGVAAAGVASLLMQMGLFRPLQGASFVTLLLASFALSQALQGVFRQVISPRARGIPIPEVFSRFVEIGGMRIGYLTIITFLVAVSALAILWLFMRHSRAGLQMRAASISLPTARLMGVRANRVMLLAFGLSGALAGVAGVLWMARTTQVTPTTGFTPILIAFIAVVLGGLGSIPGAVIGGYILGILEVYLQAYLPIGLIPFQFALALVAVSVVLYARPEGLFGKRVEEKV